MSEALRVLIVGPLPPPAGGMANQTEQLQQLLRVDGIVAEVVNTQSPYRPAWIGKLRGVRALFRMLPYMARVWSGCGRAGVVHVMANSGWSWHLFAAPAVRVAKLRRRHVVVNYRGGLAREFLSRSARHVLPVLKSTTLVVPSKFLQEVFGEFGAVSRVIPNVVNLERFHPAVAAMPHRHLHVVVPRNLESIYGNDLALRAVALLRTRLPELRLSVAGGGPERSALEALAAELGIANRVTFTGRLSPDAMAVLLREADVVLNPVRVDNMPNAVLEALASGVPVVSTRVGGVPYMLEHGRTGWLVDPESPEALVTGIERVLDDGTLRARLIEEGRKMAESCAWPVVKQSWFDAYRISGSGG